MRCEVLVIGGGSGGIAAALAAARLGAGVLLCEAADGLGGNAVRSLVCSWEPGVGGTGIPWEVYARLRTLGAAAIHGSGRHCCADVPGLREFPGGESVLRPNRRYADTLRRCGAPPGPYPYAFARQHWHGVSFLPEVYGHVVADLLHEAGVEVRLEARAVAVDGLRVSFANGDTVEARTLIDATADIHVARLAGCATRLGRESASEWGEPSAGAAPEPTVNGVSLLYRLTPGEEDLPPAPPCWWASGYPLAAVVELPGGDRVVNPLPLLSGREWLAMGPQVAAHEARLRADAHWQWLRRMPGGFHGFRRSAVAPAIGVREGPRILAERMLSELDLRAGLAAQPDPDLIALADHAFDTHGDKAVHGELPAPYGVPFRCLVPRGRRDLLVACRGAGFTAIAASSCRLSRTMMQIGQAAGTAAALAIDYGIDAAAVPPDALRGALAAQGVQLAWPLEPEIALRIAQ